METSERQQRDDEAAHMRRQRSWRGERVPATAPRLLILLLYIAAAIVVYTVANRLWPDAMPVRWCVRGVLLIGLAALVARLRLMGE